MRHVATWLVSGLLSAGLMTSGCMSDPGSSAEGTSEATADVAATGRHYTTENVPTDAEKASARPTRGNGITYHGGPIILGTTNVHYIWYGNWSGNTATTILTDLAKSIGGSPYFNINTTYYNGSGTHVSNSVAYSGSANDNYSHGTTLSDSAVQAVVAAQNPTDTNGIYFVLTSADVNESSGFCTQYCGWHTHATINGRDIKYAFIGNPDRCPSACEAQTTGPNGNAGADGMASIIAHELEEAVTDPDLNAWYDSRGEENADKCAWTFGTTYTANGAMANMKLGSRDFLIQQNWINRNGGSCGLSYGSTSPDFSLSASPASQTVVQGSGTSYTVTETPSGGFTGAVTLSATGLPSGATASFSTNPTTGTSTMSVSTSASTPAGSSTLTITGASGALTHTTSVTLNVTAAGGGDFSLALSPSSLTVRRRQAGSTTVNIARTGGFTGAVTFSIAGLPANTSATFTPNPDGGTTATLKISTKRQAVRGTYSFTVTGTSGTLTHTATGTLTIN